MPKPRPSRTKRTAKPADVATPVDAKLKKLWDEGVHTIEQAKGLGAQAFDKLWEAVEHVATHEPPLWAIGGYGSAAEFYREVLGETERTAQRNMRVAHFATAEQEEKFGVAKLDAALAFLEAKNGAPLDGRQPLAFGRIEIPAGGAKKTLFDATVEEIRAATRDAGTKEKRRPKSAALSAVAKTLGASKSLSSIAATEHAGLLSFRGVPIAALGQFASAVARAAGTKVARPKKKRG